MAEKKFGGAPFGTQTARFDVSGVHPQRKVPGTFTQVPYCRKLTSPNNAKLGPGTYNIGRDSIQSKAPPEIRGMDWRTMYLTESAAKQPRHAYREQWSKNHALHESRGPGMYHNQTFVDDMNSRPRSMRGICDTTGPRLFPVSKDLVRNPAPGSYGEDGIPSSCREDRSKQSPGTVGMLNNGGKGRELQLPLGSGLSPALYGIESSIDECIRSRTSKRGPYDLFTGKRTDPVPNGHLAAEQVKWNSLGPGHYSIKSFVHEWSDEHMVRKGRFSTLDHFNKQPSERIYCSSIPQCPRPLTDPGPTLYTVRQLSRPASSTKPFFSSTERTDKRFWNDFTQANNDVGAGRYNVDRWSSAQDKNGSVSVFTSKCPRLPTCSDSARERLLRERITPKSETTPRNEFLSVPIEAPC